MLSAFTSHLDKELFYTITLVGRKGKYNHTMFYTSTGKGINHEILAKEFDIFTSWLEGAVQSHFKSDLENYRDRLIKLDYVKIIFSPISNASGSGGSKMPPAKIEGSQKEDNQNSVIGASDYPSNQGNNHNSMSTSICKLHTRTKLATSSLTTKRGLHTSRSLAASDEVHTKSAVSGVPNMRDVQLGNEMASLLVFIFFV